MDLYKLLKIRVYNRFEFTLYIFTIIVLMHFLVLLINGLLIGNIFYYIDLENTGLILKGLRAIYLQQSDQEFWAPEAIEIAIFTLLTIWSVTLGWQIIISIYKCTFSPCQWESRNGFPQDCFNDLVYQGEIAKRGNNAVFLTNSGAGILLKNKYWRDFNIKFKFNFESLRPTLENDHIKIIGGSYQGIIHKPKSNFMGFIFRALDLDNYFMISIGIKQVLDKNISKDGYYRYNKKLLITPHIKVDGRWEVFNRNKEFDLGALKVGDFNIVICEVRDGLLTLTLKNKNRKNILKDYKWNLPTNFRANYVEEDRSRYKESDSFFGDSTKILFHNSFGMLGFRAYGDEHVVIKDIVITKLC